VHVVTQRAAVDGVLLLDKPLGLTSNASLQRVKKLLGAAKAGHVGTLDPSATGLLPICLGEATKFSTGLFGSDKTYTAQIRLGVKTTTGDIEGAVVETRPVDVDRAQIVRVLAQFVGEIMQIPSRYSALKRQGTPLYAYARRGEVIDIDPRPIVIHRIEFLDFTDAVLQVRVECGKGTYIRVLAEDIGDALGCGASLCGLCRTRVGTFGLDEAITLPALEVLDDKDRHGRLVAVDRLVETLPAHTVDGIAAGRLLAGQRIAVDDGPCCGRVRLYGPEQTFIGLGEIQLDGTLIPQRMMTANLRLPA
jgi:tRNA pseudouridine55 synthase